jgi:hypothetical protein
MHYQCINPCHAESMETDLIHVRRWLLEDFKERTAPLVREFLAQNPGWEAFDVLGAVEAAEAPRPLRAEHRAFVLDLYIQAKWAAPAEPAMGRRLRRPLRHAVYRR